MSTSPHAVTPARRAGSLAWLLAAVLALTGLLVARPAPAAADGIDSFVIRCGIRFCLDGKEYFFAGANAYDMFTFGAGSGDTETQYMDKARIDAHFARMAADGVDVARVWMFSHESWHGFEEREGEFNEQQYAASGGGGAAARRRRFGAASEGRRRRVGARTACRLAVSSLVCRQQGCPSG
ncbi:hypothetical protein [Streptomyces sp. NPDC093795]|uniref:hypothetical protein n=1 Tax=Streptomyces sp. NPDC093795 TaxID=3366051 RepID=UPI0037F5435A